MPSQSDVQRYPYRARLVVDVYFRSPASSDGELLAMRAIDRFVGEINNALAGDPQIDGASVVDRRLFAEPEKAK